MTASSTQFTSTTLMAAAAEVLLAARFKTVPPSQGGTWAATAARIYEDEYNIVCVAIYETWADLFDRWSEDQANLIDLISRHFVRTDAKSWDGYLVLLTPSVVPASDRQLAINIQRNTRHVRKLFADGDDLISIDAVRQTLLPLLALEEIDALEPPSVLDTIQALLTAHGIDEEAAQVAITAFRDGNPVIEELHALITSKKRNQS